MIMHVILPVAGLGTRMLPLTKSIPKCMIPIGTTPAIEYIVQSYAMNDLTSFCLITGRGQGMIADYFAPHPGLEHVLRTKKKHDLYDRIRQTVSYGTMQYSIQHEARGLGHAVLSASSMLGDNESDYVIIGLGDMIFPPSFIAQMLDTHHATGASVIGVMRIDPSLLGSYGVVRTQAGDDRVVRAVEKPGNMVDTYVSDNTNRYGIVGCYIVHRDIFSILAQTTPNERCNNEIQLTDAINTFAQTHAVHTCLLQQPCFDIGRPESRRETTQAFASIDYDITRMDELANVSHS